MLLPESAAVLSPPEKKQGEVLIKNPFPGKELLTFRQALDAINMLSAMLLIDVNNRGCKKVSD